LGHISLLHSGTVPPEKIKQSLETIYKAAQRGSGLVKQILTFARKTDVQIETVEVNKMIEELGHLIQETFPKTITLITELNNNLPLITADHTQLHLALINLCVNARDAMPQGGSLKITTSIVIGDSIRKRFHDAKEDQYIRISVTDTGTGIDEATLNRIFEPFFTTKDIGKGTGLGLSVVYGIVEGHRGHIDVKSVVGKGTTFELFFPIPPEPLQLPTAQEQEETKDTRGTETILIVEDEEMLRDLLKGIIEDKGYHVLTAVDGEEAVEVYKKNQKDIALVISDMGLPKLGGWEVYHKMKEINPRVKSILASGYFDPKLKEEILKAGAKDFLQKPYQPDQILQRIRTVIDEK
ncbi:MAG TPA: ATP-binding protein, partial [Bacteroidota bacterium]|nr:ATP-binding protein [Bacteroidota bacterium]